MEEDSLFKTLTMNRWRNGSDPRRWMSSRGSSTYWVKAKSCAT